MTWALLPIKDLVRAKTRLAGVLTPEQRRDLAEAMVEDVLHALTACAGLSGVLMVSDDPVAESLARRHGVDLLTESSLGCRGLNPVITAGCNVLAARHADAVMVVHSDLPLLDVADVDALLAAFQGDDTDVVLSPDREHRGTNVLVFECGRLGPFRYGPDSCPAHIRIARDAGLRLRLLPLERVGLDIDEPADLLALAGYCGAAKVSGYTAQLLDSAAVGRQLELLAAQAPQGNWSTGT